MAALNLNTFNAIKQRRRRKRSETSKKSLRACIMQVQMFHSVRLSRSLLWPLRSNIYVHCIPPHSQVESRDMAKQVVTAKYKLYWPHYTDFALYSAVMGSLFSWKLDAAITQITHQASTHIHISIVIAFT